MDKNVALDQTAAREMVQRSGQMGVPVIVVGDEVVVGFDRRRLEGLLATANRQSGPSLGARVADASRVPGSGLPHGAHVGAVRPGSLAERLGLLAGDVIVEADGRVVNGVRDLETALARLGPGQRPRLTVIRQGNRMQL